MKKILAIVGVILLFPATSLASGGGTFGSNSPQSTSAAIIISANNSNDNDTNSCFLFNTSGNSLGSVSSYYSNPFSSSTLATAECNNPTPGVGTYFAYIVSGFSGRGGDIANQNLACGIGKTTSTCEAYFGSGSGYFATGLITITGTGGGSTTTLQVAPMNDTSSTALVGNAVFQEIVTLPIFILQKYETPLVGMAIIIALFLAIFGILKYFDML